MTTVSKTSPLRAMTELEAQVYNLGEKLIPGVSHGMEELIRHASSYDLFRKCIFAHMQETGKSSARILDLGCGAGWGSAYLARIPGAKVTGIDICPHSIAYAKQYHRHRNSNFFYADIVEYADRMPAYDYIVSRNMVEHVPDGIELFKRLKWNEMLLLDVPYREPEGANLYHLLHMVDESHFRAYEHPLFLYQDLQGVVYDTPPDNVFINVMFVLCQHQERLSHAAFSFPIKAWQPTQAYSYYDQSQAGKSRWFLGNRLRVHE